LVIPDAVTAEVLIGFVVDHVRVTLQLLAPIAIVQEGEDELSVPVINLNEADTVHGDVIAPVV